MNEYVREKLLKELNEDVDRRYGAWLKTFDPQKNPIRRSVSMSEKKNGEHTGSAVFYYGEHGQKSCSALYEYKLNARSGTGDWYMVRDWND